jgi:putative N6-adenine-specific DNA methylase
MDNIKIACPCVFGTESIAADEIKALGYTDVKTENGRVVFSGDEQAVSRAKVFIRCPERVLILLSEFYAFSFEDLFQGIKKIRWEDFVGRDDAFPVKGWTIDSELHAVSACQSIIKKAVVEHLKEVYRVDWFKETGSKIQIQFSILKNKVSVYLDTTGDGLYKRGYKQNALEAPLKETRAAALVEIARFYSDRAYCDPMCGSGTILIEAAMIGHNIAPGMNRNFAAEEFHLDPKIWSNAKEEAKSLINHDPLDIFGYDIDPEAVKLTLQNAKNAGVDDVVRAEVQDIRKLAPTQEHGTIITNPPYGERMLDIDEAEKLYSVMGKTFLNLKKGWRFYIISPDEKFETYFGKKADKKRKIYNGMIKCNYFQYFRR